MGRRLRRRLRRRMLPFGEAAPVSTCDARHCYMCFNFMMNFLYMYACQLHQIRHR